MHIKMSEEFHMTNFKNNEWLVFQCLMEGYLVVKSNTGQAENIWCFSPDPAKSPNVYYTEKVINVLLREGIVAESDELPEDFKDYPKRYVLTEAGRDLSDEFKEIPPEKAMCDFLSRIAIIRQDRM